MLCLYKRDFYFYVYVYMLFYVLLNNFFPKIRKNHDIHFLSLFRFVCKFEMVPQNDIFRSAGGKMRF